MVTNAEDLEKCSKFIEEVKVVRFNKVKDRQVRKFTNLLAKNRALDNNRQVNLARQDNNASRGNRQANNTGKNNTNNNNSSNNKGSSNNRDNQAHGKWVINLPKQKLTEAQISVLAKGPNFSKASNNIPNLDYITTVETMCGKLKEEDTMALRTDINALLRKAKIPEPNLTKEERIGLTQPKKDQDRVVFTADKGVALVVMDKQEYISKAEALLAQPAYKTIPREPTNKIKAQLITKLRRIKREDNLDEVTYKAMYPTSCVPPKFYGLPKIYKTGNPPKPIISRRGSVTYGVAKVISKVLKPLVGRSPHHIQSTGDFVSKAKRLTLQMGECLSSYDLTSLFTSVPIDPAHSIIKDLLEKDEKLNDRAVLSVQNIMELLGFCLNNMYFCFQNKFYEQVEGVAI